MKSLTFIKEDIRKIILNGPDLRNQRGVVIGQQTVGGLWLWRRSWRTEGGYYGHFKILLTRWFNLIHRLSSLWCSKIILDCDLRLIDDDDGGANDGDRDQNRGRDHDAATTSSSDGVTSSGASGEAQGLRTGRCVRSLGRALTGGASSPRHWNRGESDHVHSLIQRINWRLVVVSVDRILIRLSKKRDPLLFLQNLDLPRIDRIIRCSLNSQGLTYGNQTKLFQPSLYFKILNLHGDLKYVALFSPR